MKIIEARPMSKKKRWTLVEVVEKSREVDVAAMRAARKAADEADSAITAPAASEAPTVDPAAE